MMGKMTWRALILQAIVSVAFVVRADFISWSPKGGVSPHADIEAYRNLRISRVPAEFHADTDNAGACCWSERRREFLLQMDLKERSVAEVSGLSRFLDDSARACYEKVLLLVGRGSGTNDTVKRYSRGDFVVVDPSVRWLRHPVACRLKVWANRRRLRMLCYNTQKMADDVEGQ